MKLKFDLRVASEALSKVSVIGPDLVLKFNSGGEHIYFGAAHTLLNLDFQAVSWGKWYNSQIRNKYVSARFDEVRKRRAYLRNMMRWLSSPYPEEPTLNTKTWACLTENSRDLTAFHIEYNLGGILNEEAYDKDEYCWDLPDYEIISSHTLPGRLSTRLSEVMTQDFGITQQISFPPLWPKWLQELPLNDSDKLLILLKKIYDGSIDPQTLETP